MPRRCHLLLPLLCVVSAPARAEPLTLSRVVELARSRAPDPVVARARVEETRGGLVGAGRFATRNPVLEIDLGPRWSDGRSTDVQSSISFPIDLGGRRGKRLAAVEADILREQHEAGGIERITIATAVAAYYHVLHTDRRLALAEDRVRLADAAETTARQRARAGDVAEFEVNLARGEVARAKSAVVSAKGDRARARAQLAAVLGLSIGDVSVTGDLTDRKLLEGTTTAPTTRPDLRALAQEVELARAEAAVARAERWPSLDLRITYEHERDADIVLGGIAIALPLFEHGQGDAARARARGRRAEVELGIRSTFANAQLAGARETHAAAVAAVQILEQEALPLSIENETAASASYRAGKIELGTLLVIRREVLDTRREHLDRLLDAALAAVDLWIARGTPTIP